MIPKKYSGMFWHVHHDKLMEWSGDIRERIKYVNAEKPKGEIKVRLKLLRRVKGKVPAKWNEACAKWKKAYAKLKEADAKWNEAHAECLPELEKLHKKECNCKEWNGKQLRFP